MMSIVALLISVVTLLTLIAGGVYAKRRITKVIGEFHSSVVDYLTQADSEGNTEAGKLIQALANQIVEIFDQKITTRTMANNSHISRQANLLEQDMTQDYIESQHPLLGLFLDSLGPRTKKRLLKPSAVQAFMPYLEKFMKPPGSGNGQASTTSDDWIKRLSE